MAQPNRSAPGLKGIGVSLAALLALTIAQGTAARAQISVTPTVTPGAGLFTYSYSITNGGTFDLAFVNIAADGVNSAVTAPTGFIGFFDPGVRLVTFAEDADAGTPQTFAPGLTISGFSFTSLFGPVTAPFDAMFADRKRSPFPPGASALGAGLPRPVSYLPGPRPHAGQGGRDS